MINLIINVLTLTVSVLRIHSYFVHLCRICSNGTTGHVPLTHDSAQSAWNVPSTLSQSRS